MKAEQGDTARTRDKLHRCGPAWIHFDRQKHIVGSNEIDAADSHQRKGFGDGVHERNGVWTAIFPEMVEGDYELIDDDGHWLADVTITGGEVEELDLR